MPAGRYRNFQLLLVSAFLLFNTAGCDSQDNPLEAGSGAQLTTFQKYLLEVTYGNEFGSSYDNIRKWEHDVHIYVPVNDYPELNAELDSIIEELNGYGSEIRLKRVDSRLESNFVVYFGDSDTYVSEYESSAADRVYENQGLFWIYWDGDYRIYEGSMYIDVYRTKDPDCRKHLLREELTQSLGMMNDSNKYSDSIFYNRWTCTTSYSEMDRKVIQAFQSSEIRAGMEKQEVIDALENL